MLKKLFIFGSGLSFLVPALAFADPLPGVDLSGGPGLTGTGGVFEVVGDIIGKVIPILIAIGVIIFIVGVLQYVLAKGPEDKAKGQSTMLYGIIGLFVMVSVWGLVAILNSTFGIDAGGTLGGGNIPGVGL